MKGLKEFSENVTELNKQLKDLEKDVSNKEAKKINLESDIRNLTSEQKILETKVKDLKKTLADELEKALAPAKEKIETFEDKLKNEISQTQIEKGKATVAQKNFEDKSAECDRAIRKNQDAAKALELENTEIKSTKQKLLGVITMIKDALK